MTTDSAAAAVVDNDVAAPAAAADEVDVAAKAAASEGVTSMTVRVTIVYLKLKVLAATEHAVHYVVSPLVAQSILPTMKRSLIL
mmetsp:Transcript_16095/g.32310  ORF Transcript_16095/g.32310 Transcript_16095/m.32310 type:complete len:84 (-) Transcript_16095:47-298(-)